LKIPVKKLESLGYVTVQRAWFYVPPFDG